MLAIRDVRSPDCDELAKAKLVLKLCIPQSDLRSIRRVPARVQAAPPTVIAPVSSLMMIFTHPFAALGRLFGVA